MRRIVVFCDGLDPKINIRDAEKILHLTLHEASCLTECVLLPECEGIWVGTASQILEEIPNELRSNISNVHELSSTWVKTVENHYEKSGLVSLRNVGLFFSENIETWLFLPRALRLYLNHELGIFSDIDSTFISDSLSKVTLEIFWQRYGHCIKHFAPVFEAEIFESGRGLWTPPADRRDTHKEAKAVQKSVCPDGAPVWLPYEGEAIKAENVQGSTAPKKQGFAAHIGASDWKEIELSVLATGIRYRKAGTDDKFLSIQWGHIKLKRDGVLHGVLIEIARHNGCYPNLKKEDKRRSQVHDLNHAFRNYFGLPGNPFSNNGRMGIQSIFGSITWGGK